MTRTTLKTFTPYQQAKTTYDCWIFTFRIWASIENDDITSVIYNRPINLNIGEETKTWVLPPDNQKVNSKLIVNNFEHITLGACFLTFDKALDDAFGDKPKIVVNDIDSLRVIIYMFRCAFAHNPLRPKWLIKKEYRGRFCIKEINFEIDFGQLHRKELALEQHGGLEPFWKLMKYCLTTIENKSVGNN